MCWTLHKGRLTVLSTSLAMNLDHTRATTLQWSRGRSDVCCSDSSTAALRPIPYRAKTGQRSNGNLAIRVADIRRHGPAYPCTNTTIPKFSSIKGLSTAKAFGSHTTVQQPGTRAASLRKAYSHLPSLDAALPWHATIPVITTTTYIASHSTDPGLYRCCTHKSALFAFGFDT